MKRFYFAPTSLADMGALFFLAAMALCFWGDCLWGGKMPVAAVYQKYMLPWAATASAPAGARQWDSLLWDSMAQFYPWRLLLYRAAQQGQLPLWNPYQFGGYPFVGNGQSALFYPPNWLYFFISPKIGLGLSAALHVFLGGLFMWGLARAWNLSALPALFAAIAFSYGGFITTWIELPTLPNSLIWLPLYAWGVEQTVCAARKPSSAYVGLAAHNMPQSAFVPVRKALLGIVMMACASGMSLLAGHFQIAAYVWIFGLIYALCRVASVLPRGAWLRLLGAIVLALGLGLLLAGAQLMPTLELGALSARGAGGPSPAGFVFHKQRALQPLELLTLLWPDFLGSPVRGDYPGISYSEHCGFVGAITIVLGVLGFLLKPRRLMCGLFGGMAILALWGAMGGLPAQLLYWGVPKLGQAGGFSRLLSIWTWAAAMWGAAGLQALLEQLCNKSASGQTNAPEQKPGTKHLSSWTIGISLAAFILLLGQLIPWAYRFNPRAAAEDVYPETELIRQLKQRINKGRYVAINPRARWTLLRVPTNIVLPPNAATVYELRSVDGYDSLFPAAYRTLAGRIEGQDPAPAANGNMLLCENASGWLAEGADLAVLPQDIALPPLTNVVWKGEGCLIISSPQPQPRAWMCSSLEAPWEEMKPVKIAQEKLNSLRLRCPAQPQKAFLVFREKLDHNWLALGNGQKLREQADTQAKRVILVPPGTKNVDFVYFPRRLVVGLFGSLIAIMLLCGMLVYGRIGMRQWPATSH